ncbi:hypothetical protein SAMN02910355_1404 [Terrisporobacter glycolicus]|nr:hypothetical protein SAMN02910355_1404 [Terrisporobacter glycolicus]
MKNNKDNKLLKIILGILITISAIYMVILIICLSPYVTKFLNNYYVIEPNDLPNYSDMFNSLFVTINIIVTSIFSYVIYKIYVQQYNTSYNADVAGSATMLYYALKFNLISSTCNFLNNNIDDLIPELYLNKKESNGDKYIIQNSIGIINTSFKGFIGFNRIVEFEEYLKPVVGNIKNESTRMKLFTICEDIRVYYSKTNQMEMNDSLVYIFPIKLIESKKLMERSSNQWIYILYNMYHDDWCDLNEDYKTLMNTLRDISKPKK